MSSSDSSHEEEIRKEILEAFSNGKCDFDEVLCALGGPQPELVAKIYGELDIPDRHDILEHLRKSNQLRLFARRMTAELPLLLPAPDPVSCQWWFQLETIDMLSDRISRASNGRNVAFLASPTVAYHYAFGNAKNTTVLDIDPDVIAAFENQVFEDVIIAEKYDTASPIPEHLKNNYGVVLTDPPWVPTVTDLFIQRARELITPPGVIICVLPSKLTRPGLIEERTALIKRLVESNFEIISIETDQILYEVPHFEYCAYHMIPGFTGRPWRRGDLLTIGVTHDSGLKTEYPSPVSTEIFYRNKNKFRVFLRRGFEAPEQETQIQPVPEFSNTISSRSYSIDNITIWTSEKQAIKCKNAGLAARVIENWSAGCTVDDIVKNLSSEIDDPLEFVSSIRETLNLWEFDESSKRISVEDLTTLRNSSISALSANPSGRNYTTTKDTFRIEFQRDRDRILWSQSLKTLSAKTQVFPVKSDDQLRRRLTHSIEVAQIASTISRDFGLDRDLTEAGAYAHDLGHTPFGHAGEHALNAILNDIDKDLGGFNHYEHGVDVVRWLEDMYRSPGSDDAPGLNLIPETVECIFKHGYSRDFQSQLSNNTKYHDLHEDVSCHLEGQAVRLADKISYLISDLEDGIRMGAIKKNDLLKCRFFTRAPIDIEPQHNESLLDRFISQRRSILKILMEDAIESTDKKLSAINDSQSARSSYEYLVDFSPSISADVKEIWKKLQAGKLHTYQPVVTQNSRTAQIIRDLLIIYILEPDLIDEPFKKRHRRLHSTEYMEHFIRLLGGASTVTIDRKLTATTGYKYAIGRNDKVQSGNIKVNTANVIMARDYIASLSDVKALKEHQNHYGNLWF